MKKYDVFVFELYEASISKGGVNGLDGARFSPAEAISICDQILQGLIELEDSDKCHNDLKPDNILYNDDLLIGPQIRISDFGQAGRTGGTPGWTWPKFLSERQPGKSDVYSGGLLLLYVMSDDREVFYRIRNNYVENRGQQWLTDFRNNPFFKLIIDMMNLKVKPKEAKDRWDQVSDQVQIVTKDYLRLNFRVDDWYLTVQDGMSQSNLASASLLDR